MPHEQPYLDRDYADRCQAKIEAELARTQEIIEINNACLKASKECPIWNHTQEDCDWCGNEPCVEAFKAKEKLEKELGI